ncbi:TonB-dependent receptor [uncultured Roseivirga sp.]|uniref:TonB-dependent receptor plug domain-containing protein n=1 Tax=uncultured Roseivirga sp. TaxID=543088 RepID=UPI0030D88EDA
MRTAFSLILTLFSQVVFGQKITLLDDTSGAPIEGVAFMFQPIDGGYNGNVISDENGAINLKAIDFPIVIRTQHVAYQSITDTLGVAKDYVIRLEPKKVQLDDFIVTGQFNPQSAEQSVFTVKVIDQEDIKARGAINLAEALSNSLNIRYSQDLALGSTGISMQGISGQNVKILLDGIPLVNRNGNGNAADLSQVNLNNIERIEIVEGPMAVNYGANALAGVINLISYKDAEHTTEISVGIQEETVGSEFGADKGKHIQNININQQIASQWFAQIGVLHSDFKGYQGSLTGRPKEWNPKEQFQTNALIKFSPKNSSVYYRFDYLDETIDDLGRSNDNYLPTGENQPFAIDEEYLTQRTIHQIQAEGKLPFLNRYNAFASYSDFERVKSRFSKNLVTGEKQLTTASGDQDISTYKVWEFGGTGYLAFSDLVDLQTGYNLSFEKVGGGRIQEGEQQINDVAIFSSLEWEMLNHTTVRPGVRLVMNSVFGTQLIPSIQIKKSFDNASLRLAYGRGYRSPSVRELYFEFVDSNHRIFGNPDLTPEFSHHISANFSKPFELMSAKSEAGVNIFYNTIEDQIGMAQSASDATSTTYINVDKYKTIGLGLNQKMEWSRFSASLGLSYIGRYNRLDEDQEEELNTFFYTPEVNANLQYDWEKIDTKINVFYKYTGGLRNYLFSEDSEGEQQVTIGEVEDYHWLDLTLSKTFFNHLYLVFGAKNLLDIQRINNSGVSGGTHSGGASVPVSYGRSYFIKLNYNLKLK